MTPTDIFATAKANLRDNVKTLIGVFGGTAGVLLAGTPFSGYGALPEFTGRWWVASLALLAAIALMGLSVWLLMRLLRPDLVYQSALKEGVSQPGLSAADREEIEALRAEFQVQRVNLLPDDSPTLAAMEAKAEQAYIKWRASVDLIGTPGAPADVVKKAEQDRQDFDDLNDGLTAVNQWGAFVRLRFRIVKGSNTVFLLGLGAIVAIGTFSWAVGKKPEQKADDDCKQTAVCMSPSIVIASALSPETSRVVTAPELEPLLFETGSANISIEAMAVLARARGYLRSHAEAGLLIFAYTDTQGNAQRNRSLASRRALSVKAALTAEGGVAASRIFVAELPETDLPTLTGRATNSTRNRSVQLVLLPSVRRVAP